LTEQLLGQDATQKPDCWKMHMFDVQMKSKLPTCNSAQHKEEQYPKANKWPLSVTQHFHKFVHCLNAFKNALATSLKCSRTEPYMCSSKMFEWTCAVELCCAISQNESFESFSISGFAKGTHRTHGSELRHHKVAM
jgi:hypothetical protein